MQTLMVTSNEQNKRLWNHAYKCAFYSYNLARNFCKGPEGRSCIEDSYVCGLLHDMGKIIFETAHPDILKKLTETCEKQGLSIDMFERMVAGVNHGELGALIAEKWNFPKIIVDVIRYHHAPENAPQETKKLTSLIYLADLLVHYGEGDIDYEQIDETLLQEFKITTEEQLEGISNKLKKSFVNE